ncbi:cell division protein FtsZ [bacterium]|nr:cell division protein FtsZ [bacterium]
MYEDYSSQNGLNPAKIKVIGVGGCGGNVVNRMITDGVQGVDFWVMNTDLQVLKKSAADESHRIQLGASLTNGLGAGGNPSVGERAAEESQERIAEALKGADMVFITAGMGGGSGTGASPVVAKIARDSGALTIAVVTKPFTMEGKRKMNFANEGLSKLKEAVDATIIVPNQKLMELVDQRATLNDAFKLSDEVLKRGVQGISDIITIPGLINVDFADVKAVMANSGSALMGIGIMSGDGRAVQAAEAAISSKLLESSIKGASGVILNVTGGPDMTLHEINAAAEVVQREISEDANFTLGAVINEDMMNTSEIQITVIATGFDLQPNNNEKDKARNTLDINAIFSGKQNNANHSTQNVQAKPSATNNVAPSTSANEQKPNTVQSSSSSNSGEVELFKKLDIPDFLQKP